MGRETDSPDSAAVDQAALPSRIWTQWRRAAHAIGVVQTRFLMLVIYVLVVVPTGMLLRMSSDPMHLRPPDKTNCLPASHTERTIDAARRQF